MLGHVYKYSGIILADGKIYRWRGETQAKSPEYALKLLSKKFLDEVGLHGNSRTTLQMKFLVEKETIIF